MIGIILEVFALDSKAKTKTLLRTSTECSDPSQVDVLSITKTMRFLYPKMRGLTLTIM